MLIHQTNVVDLHHLVVDIFKLLLHFDAFVNDLV